MTCTRGYEVSLTVKSLKGYAETPATEPSERENAIYRRNYGKEPASNARIKEMYRKEADRVERMIWDQQMKAGCKIPGDEMVARDAEREGNTDAARRIRPRRAKIR